MWQDVKLLNVTANILLSFVIFSLLVSGLWWLIHRPIFDLTVVRIEAAQAHELRHINALAIRDQALPRIKGNFFTTNLETVKAAFESVPWVRKVTVRRVWPDQLIVNVEEHEVLGTWGEDGKLFSAVGDVFTANLAEAEEDVQLVNFVGPEGSEKEVLMQYLNFREWFATIGLVPDGVQYSGRYAWTVHLNNGLRVDLGRVQDTEGLKKRVGQLVQVYPQLITRLQDSIESVDMRYPNGLALKTSKGGFGLSSK